MAHPSETVHDGNQDDDGPTPATTTGTSRWQKVVGIGALILVLLFVLLQVAGGGLGQHRPGGDSPPVDGPEGEAPAEHQPPPWVPDHG